MTDPDTRTPSPAPVGRTVVPDPAGRTVVPDPAERTVLPDPAERTVLSDPAERTVVLHADDVGMCHGANVAFLELSQRGLITCGSVMVPCPWFLEAAAMAREHPELDLGVHLTITSEWKYYRWGPISTRDRASGLIDPEGYFYHRTPQAAEHLHVDAVVSEFHAQIETALAAGIDVTHIDSHMGTALLPGVLEAYANLAAEYRVPVLIPRDPAAFDSSLEIGGREVAAYRSVVEHLAQAGMPTVDHFRISPACPSAETAATYRALLADLPAGLTYISLHPNAPGDIEVINPPRAFFRVDEYRLLQDASFREFVAEQHLHLSGYRPLRERFRAAFA